MLTIAWAAPDLRVGAGPSSDRLVIGVRGALLACAAWVWVGHRIVVAQALAAGTARLPRGAALAADSCSGLWRSSSVTRRARAAAGGHGRRPDPRECSPACRSRSARSATCAVPAAPGRPTGHVVRPGDTLWAIAAARPGPAADDAGIAARWHRIYRLNRP